jgi:hAT family C-terminal dimerisation region
VTAKRSKTPDSQASSSGSKESSAELRDELHQYLSTDPEFVDNVLAWWFEKHTMYPCLSRMALDYLTIPGEFNCYLLKRHLMVFPATSVDVERIFSRGRLILSHICNRLSAQTTHALLYLGSWSLLGMVRDEDVLKVALLQDVEGEEEVELMDGWDAI